jgi:hypothetical protein
VGASAASSAGAGDTKLTLTNYIERSTDPTQIDGSYLLTPGSTQNV